MAINLYKGVDAQADLARKRAAQTEATQVTGQREAMNRRMAQVGGGPGGVALKQDRIVANESAQRLQQANEGIEAGRMAEHGRIAGVLQGQEFARGERVAGQAWQSKEADIQRKWGTSERLGTQDWQKSERLGTQAWQTGENTLNRNELARQFDREEAMAKWVNKANTILSANNSGLSAEALAGLFSALGIEIGDIPGLTASSSPGGPPPANNQPRNSVQAPGSKNSNGETLVLVRVPGSSATMLVPESQAGTYTRA